MAIELMEMKGKCENRSDGTFSIWPYNTDMAAERMMTIVNSIQLSYRIRIECSSESIG